MSTVNRLSARSLCVAGTYDCGVKDCRVTVVHEVSSLHGLTTKGGSHTDQSEFKKQSNPIGMI